MAMRLIHKSVLFIVLYRQLIDNSIDITAVYCEAGRLTFTQISMAKNYYYYYYYYYYYHIWHR